MNTGNVSTENSPHLRDAISKTLNTLNKGVLKEKKLIRTPTDRLTKAREEIERYFREQFRGSPTLSKALEDLSAEKLKIPALKLATVENPASAQLKPADVYTQSAITFVRTPSPPPPYDAVWN